MRIPTIHIALDEQNIPRTIHGRVKVSMIALKFNGGESARDIANHYDITQADVYAAMAYFHDNREYFANRDDDIQSTLNVAKQYTSELKSTIRERMHKNTTDDE